MTAGRKREFDEDEALKAAMQVFWEKGYAGTSMADLTTSMGINKPSLYAAFGNKEQLHRRALELYGKHYGGAHLRILQDDSLPARERLDKFLDAVVRMQFDDNTPGGCLVSYCASESAGGTLPDDTVGDVKSMQATTEERLLEFFQQARASGEFDSNLDSRVSAMMIGLLINGSAVLARSGRSIDEVREAMTASLAGLNL